MKFSTNESVNQLVKGLITQGWCIKKGSKHRKVVSPEGRIATIPSTPSDRRAGKNFAQDIKRIQARRLA